MFDDIKTLFRAAMKAFGERIAPLEDDLKTVKSDIAELKAFRDVLKGGGLDDLKATLAATVARIKALEARGATAG